jgi:hypothetical protein
MHAHTHGRRGARLATGRMARMLVALATAIGVFALATINAAAVPPPPDAEFGISLFETKVLDAAGNDETRAGAHPYSARADFEINAYDDTLRSGELSPIENMRTIITKLPQGFIGDPNAAARCPLPLVSAEVRQAYPTKCPTDSWVGHILLTTSGVDVSQPIANVEPEKGYPAELGFSEYQMTYTLYPELRSDSDYGVDVTVPATNYDRITGVSATFCSWGVVQTHQGFTSGSSTFRCLEEGEPGALEKPFLTNPSTECPSVAPFTDLVMNSWEHPGVFVDARAESPLITACDSLEFEPSVDIAPTTSAPDAPTGLNVDLAFPQNDNVEGQAPPALKKAVVTLPDGMVFNPSAADGLAACSDDQLRLKSKLPMTCPAASKIGEVTAISPLLEEPVEGELFVRSQNSSDPASGEMFRLALVLQNKDRGIDVRLPGQVRLDPQSGRIETTFDNNPELPVSSIKLKIKDGVRAPLATPAACGSKTVTVGMRSWGIQEADLSDSFDISCPGQADGFEPGFSAGASSPVGGTYSPFAARITRDGGKELGRIQTTLPKGSLANLKHVDVCSEAQIASSASKDGRVTQAQASCPVGSQIGTTTVGAGAGSNPYYPTIPGTGVTGRVFLAPAHPGTDAPLPGAKQAVYGLAIEVPAVGGPFDLGTVMVRAALYVDPQTAEVTVVSDKLPRTVRGVPLNVRDIRVNVDRKNFTLNPTSCAEKQVGATLAAQDGTSVSRNARFKVGGCADLKFKPRLGLRLTGKSQLKTGKHPGVRAQVRQSGVGEAGIAKAAVTLPKSLALDPDNAQALCEFEDGTKPDLENHCPKGSIVGKARAITPLLKKELTGNVYFVKNVRKDPKTGNTIRTLPMIIVALRGEIAVNLKGESSTTKSGRLVNTFASVPDAPISRFNLDVNGGKTGILAVTRTRKAKINICAKPNSHIADTAFDGQNRKAYDRDVRLKTPCAKKKAKS